MKSPARHLFSGLLLLALFGPLALGGCMPFHHGPRGTGATHDGTEANGSSTTEQQADETYSSEPTVEEQSSTMMRGGGKPWAWAAGTAMVGMMALMILL